MKRRKHFRFGVAAEAAIGGPLASVRNSDRIRISVAQRRLDLMGE
jgi:dihydroxy-acid dehydratase